jgi:hypothetical protein
VVEIHEGVCGPQLLPKFLTCDDLAGVLEQHRQDLDGLLLKADSQALLGQFAGAKVQLEHAKAEPLANLTGFSHRQVFKRV